MYALGPTHRRQQRAPWLAQAAVCALTSNKSRLLPWGQGTAAEVAVRLHLLAGGLIWLAPSAAQPGARPRLMQRLASLPGAHLPDGSSAAQDASGLWVRQPALRLSLQAVLAAAVDSLD